MFWSRRSVFFSYREKDSQDKVRAEKLAERLRKLRLKPILEADKKRAGDLPSALYDQLSEADAVVSILSGSALQSRYIYFEALTAKVQNKWFPVVFEDPSIPEELSGPLRTKMTDAQLDDPDDPGVATFAKSMTERSSAAKFYYGTTRLQRGRKNIPIVAAAGFLFSAVALLASLLSNLGNIRTQLCTNTHFAEICARAGWPTHGQATNR
jgi:TIR domain